MAAWLLLSLLAASTDPTAGDRLFAAGRFPDAARVYRELLRDSPRDAKLLLRLGTTEYQMGSFAAALAEFRKAVAIAPNLEQAEVGLGVSLLSLDRSREAIPFLEKAARSKPSDRMALRALGHAYQKENDLFRGEPILKSLVAADPKDAESWYYLGTLLYDNNYYVPAAEALKASLALQPANERAEIYEAGALAKLGRAREAGELFGALISKPSTAANPELWLGYAQFLFENGDAKPSLQVIDRANELSPDSAKILFWRSRISMALGDMAGAETDARKAVQLAPELPNARNLLMKICRARGLDSAADEQAAWLAAHEKPR